MRYGPRAALAALALAAIGIHTASGAPAPDNILQAHPALRFDPASRCSDVRPAGPDDEPVAVVLFQVGSTGVPSKATVKASSGAADLDAAATNCVLRLRFQPATRMGDGVAIDSWQQMAWKRARVGAATALPQPRARPPRASRRPPHPQAQHPLRARPRSTSASMPAAASPRRRRSPTHPAMPDSIRRRCRWRAPDRDRIAPWDLQPRRACSSRCVRKPREGPHATLCSLLGRPAPRSRAAVPPRRPPTTLPRRGHRAATQSRRSRRASSSRRRPSAPRKARPRSRAASRTRPSTTAWRPATRRPRPRSTSRC